MPRTRRNTRQNHIELAKLVVRQAQSRGLRAGDHVPEQRFAEACGVSRTPMRAAFDMLETLGFLKRRPEEGYFLVADPVEGGAEMARQLEQTGDTLASQILRDRAARRLNEVQTVRALVQRYDTSRSAVLNALKVLDREGVVSQQPGQSWVFQPILDSTRAVDESLAFRMVLEPQAILGAGFSFDAMQANGLRQTMQRHLDEDDARLSQGGFLRLDTEFHTFVAQCAGNTFVRASLLAHHRLRRNTQVSAAVPAFRIRQAISEHVEILDGISRGDMELAADLMVVHLRRSHKVRPDAANRGIPPLTLAATRKDA